jgi:hypothetical protein
MRRRLKILYRWWSWSRLTFFGFSFDLHVFYVVVLYPGLTAIHLSRLSTSANQNEL